MYHRDGAIHPHNVSGPGQSVPHLSQHRFPGKCFLCFAVVHKLCHPYTHVTAWEPDESAEVTFHFLWREVWSPSHSDRFPPEVDPLGLITTVYLIWGGFDTITDRGASLVYSAGPSSAAHQAHETQIKLPN